MRWVVLVWLIYLVKDLNNCSSVGSFDVIGRLIYLVDFDWFDLHCVGLVGLVVVDSS